MLAALLLDQLQKKSDPVTPKDLTELYKLTYKEAYKEGQRDQQSKCGCNQDEE